MLLVQSLEKAYCGDIGVEFKHISEGEEVNFGSSKDTSAAGSERQTADQKVLPA